MHYSTALQKLIQDYGLKPKDIYLLELIPLIEIMWADKNNQEAELELVEKFATEHLAKLCNEAGKDPLTAADVNDFLRRFAWQRPNPLLLQSLRELALTPPRTMDPTEAKERQKNILNYCMDIAAACVPHYPYSHHDRVMPNEKALLMEIMQSLAIPPDRPVNA